MKKARLFLLGAVGFLVVAYFGVLNVVAPRYLTAMIPTVQTVATQYINGEVNIGELQVSNNLSLTAKDITVLDKAGRPVAAVPSVVIGISPWQALKGKSALSAVGTINVNNPVVHLTMDKQDQWNIAGLIKESEEKSTAFKGLVRINNGKLIVTTPYGKWESGVQGSVDAAQNPDYALDVDVFLGNETISLTGKINTEKKGNLLVKTSSFSVDEFGTLLAHYLPVEQLSGSVKDLRLLWSNTEDGASMSGSGSFAQAKGTVVSSGYTIPVSLDGKVSFQKMAIKAENLLATLQEQQCVINGNLDFTDSENPAADNLTIALQDMDVAQILPDVPVAGPIKGELILNGALQQLNISGKLTAKELEVAGQRLTNVQLPLATYQRTILLNGGSAEYGGNRVNFAAEYNQDTQAIIAGIEPHKVNVAPLIGMSNGPLVADGIAYWQGTYKDGHMKANTVANFMTLTWGQLVFRNLGADVDISNNNFIINNLYGYTEPGGAFVATGSIQDAVLDLDARISHLPLDMFLQLAEQEGTGVLSGHFAIKGTTDAPAVSGLFGLENAQLYGQKIVDAHGFVAWQDNILTLQNISALLEQGEHKINGTIGLGGSEPVLNLAIKTENVRIEPLAQYLQLSFPVTGNLTNTVQMTGPLSRLNVSGSVHAWDGSCNKFLVDDVAGDYVYKQGALQLKGFKIKTLTSTINVDGTMDAQGKLDFGIDAKAVHLARIPGIKQYADVEGSVDFSGTVKGTRTVPLFNGALTSDSVFINGEELTGIACSLVSEGGRFNTLKGTLQQKAGGDYAVDLRLDTPQELLQGGIDVKGGNVHSLLKMAKEELPIDGLLTGHIAINKDGKGTGTTIVGRIDDGDVHGTKFKDVNFDVGVRQGVVKINTLQANEADGGFMAAQGYADIRKRLIEMEIGCNSCDARLLTAFLEHPLDFTGKTDITAQLSGSLDNPKGNFSLQVTQGKLSGVGFDNLYGMVTLRDDMFKLEQLLIQKGIYKLSAYGTFPQDLLRSAKDRHNPNARMDLQVKLDNANLAILPSLTKTVEWADGAADGGLSITGTLEDYYVNGSVGLKKGTIKFKNVASLLENIKMQVEFKGKQVILQELAATVGKKGTLKASGSFALTKADEAPYLLNFAAKDVEIKSSVFTGQINATAEVEQKRNRPHVTANVKLDDVLLNIASVPEFGEGNSNIGLDVTLEFGPKIHMYNKYLYDLWLAGGLHVTGSTRYTVVNGEIHATKGSISYINTPFELEYAKLTWPRRGKVMPNISLSANTRFSRYTITAKANGPVDIMHMSLTSNPPKSEKELLRMLTLKTDSADETDMQGLLDAGLQMTFLGDVEDYIKRALTLDDLRIYSGSLRSGLGFDVDSFRANAANNEERSRYNFLVSKRLTKNIKAGYTSSFDGQYHSIFAEYELNKHLNLDVSMNEKHEKWYGIQYQISF